VREAEKNCNLRRRKRTEDLEDKDGMGNEILIG